MDKKARAVFLDRDGVIIEDVHYSLPRKLGRKPTEDEGYIALGKPNSLELVAGAIDGISILKNACGDEACRMRAYTYYEDW